MLAEISGPDSIVDCLIEGGSVIMTSLQMTACPLQSFSSDIQGKGHPSGHPALRITAKIPTYIMYVLIRRLLNTVTYMKVKEVITKAGG